MLRDILLCSVALHIMLLSSRVLAKDTLKMVHQWTQAEFEYPSTWERQREIETGVFQARFNVFIDVHAYYSSSGAERKIFVAIPRLSEGTPASLAVVTDAELNSNPVLSPYPSWSWHRNSRKCYPDRIVSAWAVRISDCGKLWVLDAGRIDNEIVCPPQILIFDPETDKLLHRYEIPWDQVESRSTLINFVLDGSMGCRDTFAYIADGTAYALIVYDLARDVSWKISDKTMFPHPFYGTYNIRGEKFEVMFGIDGVAVSSNISGDHQKFFFHPTTSPTDTWIYLSDIKNQSKFLTNPGSSPQLFHSYPPVRDSQSAATAINKDGILFYTLVTDGVLVCWNTGVDYKWDNFDVLTNSSESLHFVSGFKVIKNLKGEEELWLLGSRASRALTRTTDISKPNFWIQYSKIEDLLEDSKCKLS